MNACWCVLAGTKACINCPNNTNNQFQELEDYNEEMSKIFQKVPIIDYKKELEDCVFDLCKKCKLQKKFTSEWCEECRWNEYTK